MLLAFAAEPTIFRAQPLCSSELLQAAIDWLFDLHLMLTGHLSLDPRMKAEAAQPVDLLYLLSIFKSFREK